MFDNYIGNPNSIERLKTFVSNETNTNVLLTGPEGLGLRDLAIDVAKEVLNAPSLETHPDYVYIEPDESGKIGVDLIMEVIDKAMYKPVTGKYIVAVIDGLDKATVQAQNKVLKTLEDAENLLVIGVAYNSSKVLETIRSRMLIIPFKTLSEAEFKTFYKGDEVEFAYTLSRGCIEQIDDVTVEYYKPIAEAISLGEEKELFKILHLEKEKDNEAYFQVRKNELLMLFNLFETSYMDLLKYIALDEVGKICKPEVFSDKGTVIRKLELIQKEKGRIGKDYTKDDFFLFICELIAIKD